MGRPKAIIDWERVGEMFEADCTVEGVAATIGVHRDVLYRRCKADLKVELTTLKQQKKAKGDEMLREIQLKTAKAGNVTMQIWLGKQRLGQSDKTEAAVMGQININHTGEIAFAQAAAKIYGLDLDQPEVKGYLDGTSSVS